MPRSCSADRKGFDGNEDCGQMSAWYILSALGFYPMDTTSGEYEIGSPIVRGAKLKIGAPYKPAVFEMDDGKAVAADPRRTYANHARLVLEGR